MKYITYAVIAAVLSVAACAPRTHEIQSSYVSPKEYSDYSCEQLATERAALLVKAKEIGDLQEENAEADSVFVAGFLIVSMPLIIGTAFTKDRAEEFAMLKGKYEAVDRAQHEKQCELDEETRRQAFYTKPPKEEPKLKPRGAR